MRDIYAILCDEIAVTPKICGLIIKREKKSDSPTACSHQAATLM